MDGYAAGGLASDAELIAGVRAGDTDAFDALRERHLPAALVVARAAGAGDATRDEAVARAFDRIQRELEAGGGPDIAFRSYLCWVVRAESAGGAPTEPLPSTSAGPDLEHAAVVAAYASLFQRWREVLWYTDVEGLRPAAAAPVLGLTAADAADLARTAHGGFAQAYLRKHAGLTADRQAGLGETRTERDVELLDRHVEDCASCRAVTTEPADVQRKLRAAIAPTVLGAATVAIQGVGFGGPAAAAALEVPDDLAELDDATAVDESVADDAVPAAPVDEVDGPLPVVPAGTDRPAPGAAFVAPAPASRGIVVDEDAHSGRGLVAASGGVGLLLVGLFLLSTVPALGASSIYGTTAPLAGTEAAEASGTDVAASGFALPWGRSAIVLPQLQPDPPALALPAPVLPAPGAAAAASTPAAAAEGRGTTPQNRRDATPTPAAVRPSPVRPGVPTSPFSPPPPAPVVPRPAPVVPRPAPAVPAPPVVVTPPVVVPPVTPPVVEPEPQPEPPAPPAPPVRPEPEPPGPPAPPVRPEPEPEPPAPPAPPAPPEPEPAPQPAPEPAPPVVAPPPAIEPVPPVDPPGTDGGNGRFGDRFADFIDRFDGDGRGNGRGDGDGDRDGDRGNGRGDGDGDRDRGNGRGDGDGRGDRD